MVFSAQIGSYASDLVAPLALPAMLLSWFHLGLVWMALLVSLEGLLCPETIWFSVWFHCIFICLLVHSCFWLTKPLSALSSFRLWSQGTGSSALLSKVSPMSLIHFFSSLFRFY